MSKDATPLISPGTWEDADVYAIRALEKGVATEAQQRRALIWIVAKAAGIQDLSFRPGDPYTTAFNEGRRYVGTQINKLLNMPMKKAQ